MICWHRFGKWQVTAEGTIQNAKDEDIGFMLKQDRACEKCGYRQIDVQRRRGV